MEFIKSTIEIFSKAIADFIEDNCFQYSAAVSFYTLFSLAPIVMIAVYTAGLFVGDESVMRELTQFLSDTLGKESADAVLILVDTIQTDSRNIFYLIISFVVLFISATTVFIQFKDSFNRIFGIVPKDEAAIWKLLLDRVVSFGMIILLGLAMIFSLVLDSFLIGLFELLARNFDSGQLIAAAVGGNLITFLMIFFAVFMLFYILPDVQARRKPWILGSLITAVFLVIGKFGVGMIIGNSPLNELSGASASVIILMLWVYYSSIIVFFGMELVKVMGELGDKEIKAGRFARRIKRVEIDSQKKES